MKHTKKLLVLAAGTIGTLSLAGAGWAYWTTTGTGSGAATVGTWTSDATPPTVSSINRADADPTNAASVSWAVTFSEDVTGVDTGDFSLVEVGGVSGSSITGITAVFGDPATYTVHADTGSASGTLGLNLSDDDSIVDGASNPLAGPGGALNGNFTGQTYTIDKTAPRVTVTQTAGQVDPTNIEPIHFTAIFNEPVNALAANGNGVTLDGTADRTAATIVVTPTDSTHYDIAVSGLGDGTITAAVAPTATTDLAGNTNLASTSTDNTVTYDTLAPSVTVNQKVGQVDPTNMVPILYTVTFSKPVTGFDETDLARTGTSTNGTVTVSGSGASYEIAVNGALTDGTLGFTVPANGAQDVAGNNNTPSISTDNTVTYDTVAPSVTVNQKAGQADPTPSLPITYTVTFSEPVTDFDAADLTRTGTSTGGTVNVTGSGADYEIAVAGTPTNGTLTFAVGATKAIDLAGNNNTASTSTDNSVTYDTVAPATLDNSASITNAWKNTTQTVTLIPSDSGSGVAATYYTTNGTDPTTSSSTGTSVVLSADGTYTIKYFSVDSAGNAEGVKTAGTQIRIDKTAPSTTDNAPAGWTNAASVPVTLTPAETGSGLAHTYYTTDGSDPTTSSSRSPGTLVNVTAAGTTTIKYSSVDTAGNVEAVKTATVRIDRTNPTPDITFPAPNGTYKIGNNGNGSWNKGSFATSCGADQMCGPATDAASGVASVQISLKGPNGKWWDGTYTTVGGTANFTSTTEVFQTVSYSSGVWSIAWGKENFNGTGEYTLAVKVTDAAGNSATTTPRGFMTTS